MKKCVIPDCLRERLPDAIYCRVHLGDAWANRANVADSRQVQPEWLRRRNTVGLPAKDLTRAA